MCWKFGLRALLPLVALGALGALARPALAHTVRDLPADFRIDVVEPQASLCSAFPVEEEAGPACTSSDLAFGRALAAAGSGNAPISVVIAHFKGWNESILVTKDSANAMELTQKAADTFAGALRESVRKDLPADAHVIDLDSPVHAKILRIGTLQVIRTAVLVQRPETVPLNLVTQSKIAYEVIAKEATYTVIFTFDLADYDLAFAFAEQVMATVHATPAASVSVPGFGADEGQSARGTRWGWVFAIVLLLAAFKRFKGRDARKT